MEMVSLHLQANTTNIYKLSILSRSDCHLHQTVDLAKVILKPIPVATQYATFPNNYFNRSISQQHKSLKPFQ